MRVSGCWPSAQWRAGPLGAGWAVRYNYAGHLAELVALGIVQHLHDLGAKDRTALVGAFGPAQRPSSKLHAMAVLAFKEPRGPAT
jgi:hypothetical protein